MSTYAIGDVQGCYRELLRLLDAIDYKPGEDHLWFSGDLINRGPDSLAVIRFIQHAEPTPVVVLGNHDLHFLAVAQGVVPPKSEDTFEDMLNAPDCDAICDWYASLPLLHHDQSSGFTIVHAGILPNWDLTGALVHAKEVETILQSEKRAGFIEHLYGDDPDTWDPTLTGWDRYRFITNVFTRLRFCTPEGKIDLTAKGGLDTQPEGYLPWFNVPNRRHAAVPILFGHWAALEGHCDAPNTYALDGGCVWNGTMRALRLEDLTWTTIACQM